MRRRKQKSGIDYLRTAAATLTQKRWPFAWQFLSLTTSPRGGPVLGVLDAVLERPLSEKEAAAAAIVISAHHEALEAGDIAGAREVVMMVPTYWRAGLTTPR